MNYVDKNFIFDVEYKVHSIFENVINLKYGNRIYSIFNENIKKAPYSLILEKNLFDDIKSKLDTYIKIPKLKCIEYECEMPIINKKHSLDKIYKKIQNFERNDSIFEKAFQERRKNKDLFNIIGLGLGLTPSGDDYIVGIMAAYYSHNLNKPKIFKEIEELAQNRTNEISYNYILNASNKLFKQEIIELIGDLESDEKIENLLNFGSSSGQDIIYGIYDYFSRIIDI